MHEETRQPLARTSEFVVKKLNDEVLVYDLGRNKAHSLNRIAAAVWQACDGSRGVAALGAAASAEIGQPVPPDAVRYALRSLERARLLEGPVGNEGLTRREAMQRLGTAAAVALPIVTSITPPAAAQTSSCRNLNESCTISAPQSAECCGQGCGNNTAGCSCTLFKNLGLRCLQITPPPDT